ncbi:unnamed protein product [Danaus chrysippus]|uniref:(African queen) hypothetical protein n=1 Tax=Danaus chrysippus TaxID=151541 RepID=A0A8J2MW42_9NEOP|nr:unnamed protein product [Danaus chrysippus]
MAALVKRQVIHQPLPAVSLRSAYALGVEVCLDRRPVRVFAFYRPPGGRLEESDIHALLDQATPTIIAGDFNCKHTAWNSTHDDANGQKLLNDAEREGYAVMGPEVPTHYPYQHTAAPDVIDLTLVQGLNTDPSIDVLDDHVMSDHQPVLVTIDLAPIRREIPPPRHRQDWHIFADHLSKNLRSFRVDSPDDVDRLALELTESITRALEASRLSTTSHRKRPQLPAGIRDMIEDKRRLRRLYQRTRCPTIKSQLNALAERVSAVLEDHAVDSWYKTIERAGEDWSGIHRLCHQVSRKSEPIRPLLASDGTPRYRAADRAEIFADYLETQFQPNPTKDTLHAEEVERRVDEYLGQAIAPTEDPIADGSLPEITLRTTPRRGNHHQTRHQGCKRPPQRPACFYRRSGGQLRGPLPRQAHLDPPYRGA